MLDIKLIRENPAFVRENLKKRNDPEILNDLEKVLKVDGKWRTLVGELNKLKEKRNDVSMEIAEMKKKRKGVSGLIKEAKIIPEKIKKIEDEASKLEEERKILLLEIPNLVHESVPVGKDEKANKEIKKFGKIPKFGFEPKSHEEIALGLDGLDIERAAKVAGARFYYLKNDIAKLNLALLNFAMDFLERKGFVPVEPPFMLTREAITGAIPLLAFEDTIYKIEGENLYLIGTAEHSLNAYFMNEILNEERLPIKFAGISPCFRKEAGSHGKDTKGIFRVHQFDKVEQFVFSTPEDSWEHFDFLLKNVEEIFQALELPYRLVNLSSGDLGRVSAKTVDLEVWMPGQKTYRELSSCSNCTDYQARRSNIRYRSGKEIKFPHTINSTAMPAQRTIVAILENNQLEDGSVLIPKVLQPFMNGIEKLGKKE